MRGKSPETEVVKNNDMNGAETDRVEVTVMSFGYKRGDAPSANAVFDVRFLKNPYWVEELRPLNGLDKSVQDYVLEQEPAQDFLSSILELCLKIIPQFTESKVKHFTIAFGCTGGQHRSATIAETVAKALATDFPEAHVRVVHRELDEAAHVTANGARHRHAAGAKESAR
ncbi:MAG TPA: RNase adapter RapZ [Candidatus Melainabacteria bacterium]|nr:RNase adapter RapZ [Candidatus Melainabacteria bacterium]